MIRLLTLASAIALIPAAAPVAAQDAAAIRPIDGTRLDVVATGEVTRVPDIARISTGVVTQAPTASDAIRQNAAAMNKVRAALKRAGIADRDIQTSSLNLNPDYRYQDNQPPQLTGYRASTDVSVRFRDIAKTGQILDALVAQGANQINGPTLMIDKEDEAMDEARTDALAKARARADLYARAMGKRVGRILSVSEMGAARPAPMPYAVAEARDAGSAAKIDPGEQAVNVTLSVSFELQ
ncbi:SIMPL domain-containing protein [Allosphingosinicella vermicomposti]|uniref:SIMPL domain-containing protein n=1 Tax=Allosphingosinicella vermicomposti TaxID=614671 RepID=UPI000D10639A|nr:SIMPL domain-containing protein [Allosphingosinicella vermicomposti]